MVLVACF